MGFRPNVPYSRVISDLGLTSGLRLCLDAGDSSSYSSGQKWLDRSGNGYDFFLGTSAGAEASDPAFTGSIGALSPNEYWTCDTDAQFTYDGPNETWMNNLHKDGATFTILAYVYLTALGASASQVVCGTLGNGSNTGFQTRIDFSTGKLSLQVGNGTGSTSYVSSGVGLSVNGWYLFGVSINENGGASAGQFYLDGAPNGAAFNPAYTSPSAGNASFTMQVAAAGNSQRPLGGNGTARIGFLGIWEGTTLSTAQVASIYNYSAFLAAATGACAVTGNGAPLAAKLLSAAGSYALTGEAVVSNYALGAVTGAILVPGQAGLFRTNFSSSASSWSVSGNSVPLTTSLAATPGAFSETGQPALFGMSLLTDAGAYNVTGNAVNFSRNFEAWVPRPFDSDDWLARAIQDVAWTPNTTQPKAWTEGSRQAETWMPAVHHPDPWKAE